MAANHSNHSSDYPWSRRSAPPPVPTFDNNWLEEEIVLDMSATNSQLNAPIKIEDEINLLMADEYQPLQSFNDSPAPRNAMLYGEDLKSFQSQHSQLIICEARNLYGRMQAILLKPTKANEFRATVQAGLAKHMCWELKQYQHFTPEAIPEVNAIRHMLEYAMEKINTFLTNLRLQEKKAALEAAATPPAPKTPPALRTSPDHMSITSQVHHSAEADEDERKRVEEEMRRFLIKVQEVDERWVAAKNAYKCSVQECKHLKEIYSGINARMIMAIGCTLHDFRKKNLPHSVRKSPNPSRRNSPSNVFDGTSTPLSPNSPNRRQSSHSTGYKRPVSPHRRPSSPQRRSPSAQVKRHKNSLPASPCRSAPLGSMSYERSPLPHQANNLKTKNPEGLIPYSFLKLQPKPKSPCMYCHGNHHSFLCYHRKYNTLEKRVLHQEKHALCPRCQKKPCKCDTGPQYCHWLDCCSLSHHSNVCPRATYPLIYAMEDYWAVTLTERQAEAMPIFKKRFQDMQTDFQRRPTSRDQQ